MTNEKRDKLIEEGLEILDNESLRGSSDVGVFSINDDDLMMAVAKITNNILDKVGAEWISDSKKLKEDVDYVFHIHGNSLLMFGRYRKINNTLLYRFGTANGVEDGSMLLNALEITLPQPPPQ